MERRYIVVLVVGLGVAAVLLGAFLTSVITVPGPPAVRFYTFRESYHLGEFVSFRIENLDSSPLCYASQEPWSVERQIGLWEWHTVESRGRTRSIHALEQGDSMAWVWFAQDSPYREQAGYAEVLPGNYRVRMSVWPCESASNPGPEVWVIHAYFELVA